MVTAISRGNFYGAPLGRFKLDSKKLRKKAVEEGLITPDGRATEKGRRAMEEAESGSLTPWLVGGGVALALGVAAFWFGSRDSKPLRGASCRRRR